MAPSFDALAQELAAPLVDPREDTAAVASHVRLYIEARAALRALPLGDRANALVLPAGGRK